MPTQPPGRAPVLEVTDPHGTTRHADITTGTPEWAQLLEWCRAHDIDPALVPAGQVMTVDYQADRVTYVAVSLDAKGRRRVNAAGTATMTKRVHRDGPIGPLPVLVQEVLA